MKLKFWVNVITVVGLIGLVIVSRHQFAQAYEKLFDLNLWVLSLIIPIQIFSFYTIAKFYQEYLRVLGEKVAIGQLMKIALELNFVNLVFPSGGISGFSYLSMRMKQYGVSTAKSTMAQAARFALVFLTFMVLILIGLFALAIYDKANGLMILISSGIVSLTLFGTAIMVYIISSKSRINGFVAFLPKAINGVVRKFRRRKDADDVIDMEKVEHTLEELHDDYISIARDWRKLKPTLFWAFMINVAELATIYVVFVAHGAWINIGALVISYAVANFAGLISLFHGVGVYEFLMTSIMASAGVPAALALSATVIYRVLNMVLFLPVGYLFYRTFVKQKTGDPDTTPQELVQ